MTETSEGAQLGLQEKLGLDVFKIDSEKPHIVIDHAVCRERCTVRPCLYVCPAKLYTTKPDSDDIFVAYEGCLDFGRCAILGIPALRIRRAIPFGMWCCLSGSGFVITFYFFRNK